MKVRLSVIMKVLEFAKKSLNGLHNDGIARIKAHPPPLNQIQRRGLSDSNVFNGHQEDTVLPVLIVGAGPVGLVLAILLTKLGITSSTLVFSFLSRLAA